MIAAALRSRGHAVLEARDAYEALRLAERQPDDLRLLVTDVRMPQVDGVALAKAMTVLRPGLPVLFVSGQAGDLGGALGPGQAFLHKPFIVTELLAVAERLIRE